MAAVEVPQTLEYTGGKLNAALVLEVENFTNWKKRFMCHIIGIEPQFENIIKNGPFIPMKAGQRKPENQWTGDERKAANLDQRLKSLIMSVLPDDQINCHKLYKALMNELVNDGIKLSKLEINTGFINGLPKKWLSFCQSLRNTNNIKDFELASLFGIKYEENLIDIIYGTEKNKSLVSATPLSTAFFSSSIVQDLQDSPDDEEDTRSSHEYLNDLEEEYQARALLEKSKRFFKKDEEEVSSDDNEMVEVKVLMALAEENNAVSKEGARIDEWVKISMRKCISEQIPSQKKRILGIDQLTKDPSSSWLKDLVFVKSSADDTKVTIPGVERPWLSEAEGFILPNHDTGRILPSESQRNTTDPSVVVTNSSVTDYDSADESSVCSTPLPPLKKFDGVIINEPSSAPSKDNKSSSASKVHSAPAGKLKSVKIKDDHPLAICERTDHRTCDHAEYISTMNMSQHLKSLGRMSSRPNIPRPSKRFFPPCIHCGACGSPNHTTTDHYDIEWFKKGKALQAKKAEALKSTRDESSNAIRPRLP
ncbi:hypothetical protein Tco_1448606 [Tanacetum coccineum]